MLLVVARLLSAGEAGHGRAVDGDQANLDIADGGTANGGPKRAEEPGNPVDRNEEDAGGDEVEAWLVQASSASAAP